jgi:hypothetical protein
MPLLGQEQLVTQLEHLFIHTTAMVLITASQALLELVHN